MKRYPSGTCVDLKGGVLTGCMHLPVGLALLQANLDVIKNSMSGFGLQDKKKILLKAAATFIL